MRPRAGCGVPAATNFPRRMKQKRQELRNLYSRRCAACFPCPSLLTMPLIYSGFSLERGALNIDLRTSPDQKERNIYENNHSNMCRKLSCSFRTFTRVLYRFCSDAFGVMPPPDGGYPNKNTAEGQDALFSLTNGTANTANGFSALKANTRGDRNTANGALALFTNVTALTTRLPVTRRSYSTGVREHGQRCCGALQQRNRRQQHGQWPTGAL